MFGSIYIGLSGLNAYSRGLQQISNNISNLNSQGFRSSSVSFRDSFGTRGRGTTYTGSSVASGHGVSLADTQLNFAQGERRQTERDLDLAIDGSGMLTLLRGNETLYTRTGSFEVDKDGFITLSGTEYRLATLQAGRPVALSIDAQRTSKPVATTAIKLADNLSSTATAHDVTDLKVYDSAGGEHVWKLAFTKATAAASEWTVTVTDATGATIGTQVLKFTGGVIDPANAKLTITDTASSLPVDLDFTGVTSFSSGTVSTLRSASIDGYPLGTAASILVNAQGQLEISYTNQQKAQLGNLAIADFRDPQALVQQSGGLFTDDGNAQRELLASGDKRVGTVLSRRLEASNVDLSKEFGDLILIQRGFQASSQIISVTNDMIQQLFGIRGQG